MHGPRLLTFPRAAALAVALAALLRLPALGTGHAVDEYWHLALLEGALPVARAPDDLFSFVPGDGGARALVERGPLPWWTLPELRLAFFRPLSSLLIAADHALFGRGAAGPRAHSILWFLALVAAWGLVLRRVLPGPVAALALVLFAVDGAHWMPSTWPPNRNAVLAALAGVLGLMAHLRRREHGWRPGVVLSLACFAVAFACGEIALGVMAYVVAFELFAARDGARRRLAALAPLCALAVLWLVAYRRMGYGAHGSGSYIDPTREPLAYALAAAERAPALLAGELAQAPCDLWILWPALRLPLAAVGIAALAAYAALLGPALRALPEGERRTVRWMLWGSLLALLPVVATFPMSRLVLVPSLGASVATAIIVLGWWRERRLRPRPPRARRAAGAAVALVHVVLAPLLLPLSVVVGDRLWRKAADVYLRAELDHDAHRRVVVLVAPDPLAPYGPVVRFIDGARPMPAAWWILSEARYEHRFARTGPRTLEMTVPGGHLLETEAERFLRAPRYALGAGDRVRLDGLDVVVREVDAVGPTRVEFRFDRPLEHPSLLFLAWRDGRLGRVTLPPVGGSLAARPRELF